MAQNNLNKEFEQLKQDYKIIFGGDEGQRIFKDLKLRFHEYQTTHQKGDPYETAFNEGQRSVLNFIKAMINSKT